ncbi:hypothetical protein CABS01_05211 [Colletotrichum abscissum]|uniref:Uncharacterized protein n=2 Tax=Colletotrichum acutatum species complex TaxID=2707335 RepID=A0A9Q8WFB2_9PEZI|nr:uncharacterized protein CLUP02_06191 [Colletotrichum lupini]XP_060384704.1 uncharacterized protein CTAM01_04720 [Colletotrichum tamarilloi]XP_060405753.1 uncharacterized protein CABS01_05211 [Colletotrichum abscissum]KAK1503408.1 hypothetical protein CTAM01_04720 [Colletotrichum tamarilloi]KAK1523590.1 hypothetical protein CABS01_05211 [Colletotrichum abscissum]KAK1714718.1 hypothetical protein BDP67DRAFT_512835 [Colletotrichum lupini]UQC80707.1 hypothetical protein CLUP02_06191 [Colletotr
MCGFGHSPQQGYDSEQGCMGPPDSGVYLELPYPVCKVTYLLGTMSSEKQLQQFSIY